MKKNDKFVVIIASLFASFYLLVISGDYTDFDFWHISTISKLLEQGWITSELPISGYLSLNIILCVVTNIDPIYIPISPILLYPSILTFYILFQKLSNNNIISILLVIGLLFTSTYPGQFTFGAHEIAYLLFISTLIMLLRCDNNHIPVSIVLITIMIAMNYISYKFIYISFCALSILLVLQYAKKLNQYKYLNIVIITFVVTMGLNQFIYNAILPKLVDLGSSLFYFESAVHNNSLFADYLFVKPPFLTILHIIWLIILGGISAFYLYLNYKNMLSSINHRMIVSLFISGVLITLLYFALGLFTTFIISLVCFMMLAIIQQRVMIKHIIAIILIILISINVITIGYDYTQDTKSGQNISSVGDDAYAMSLFCKMSNESFSSDIFTSGYVFNRYNNVNNLKEKDMADILINHTSNNYLIMNYHLRHFSIENWQQFSNWESIYKPQATNNVVYNSGGFVIIGSDAKLGSLVF